MRGTLTANPIIFIPEPLTHKKHSYISPSLTPYGKVLLNPYVRIPTDPGGCLGGWGIVSIHQG